MNQYEQRLAKWEAERRKVWQGSYDDYYDNGIGTFKDSAIYTDTEVRAWERRHPRPEPPQKPAEPVPAPDYIGCQELMYTRDGVKLSNGFMCSLEGLRALHKGSQLLHCRNGSPGLPDGYRFYGVGGYNGTYHNGYILIEGFRITTAQLAAMIERCEVLARGPEVDLSKRWKVVFNPNSGNITRAPNFGMGTMYHTPQPANGFITKAGAEAYLAEHKQIYGTGNSYAILPYLATSLPKKEKRWELWYKGDKMANLNYVPDEWTKAETLMYKSIEKARNGYRALKSINRTLVYEIREVEVEVDE